MATYWVELNIGSSWADWTSDSGAPAASDEAILSVNQYDRAAKRVQKGDVLLHFVLGVHCWSGYSHVLAPPVQMPNPQTEWAKAYPYSIRICPGQWLRTPYECSLTHSIPGLSRDNWHRKAYVKVKPADALLVEKAVDEAYGKNGKVEPDFLQKWNVQRDANASERCKSNAKYCCALCGTCDSSWCRAHSIVLPVRSSDATDLGWFLDAHHIRSVADGGVADPEELLCVCPNCHRVVQRLGETGLRDLLRQRGVTRESRPKSPPSPDSSLNVNS